MSDQVSLVFDEAEALFSKRVEAKGSGEIAHNSQIGLLLSRLERFNGLAILTTNNQAMIDPAFKRRFHGFEAGMGKDGGGVPGQPGGSAAPT